MTLPLKGLTPVGTVLTGPYRCPSCNRNVDQIQRTNRNCGYMWLCKRCVDQLIFGITRGDEQNAFSQSNAD